MCQLTNFGASNEQQSPKSESTWKTEQDTPFRKTLTFGQRSTQKSKSTGPRSKSTDTDPGRFWVFRVRSRIKQQSRWRHPMMCRWDGLWLMWTCLRGYWRGVMTSATVCWRVRVGNRHVEESLGKLSTCGGACNILWALDFSGLQIGGLQGH